MSHTRIRKFNTADSYPEQKLDNDLCQAVRAGNTVYLRGQIGQDLDTRESVGTGDAEAQAERAMDNIALLLDEAGARLEEQAERLAPLAGVSAAALLAANPPLPADLVRYLDSDVGRSFVEQYLEARGGETRLARLAVGYGANYLTAIEIEGRLVLQNGSHRAYALREAGHTRVPCLIQRVSRREELEAIIGADHELNRRPELFLEAARPPVLKDYFDPQLRMLVHVPRTARQLRVAVNFEAFDVPTT